MKQTHINLLMWVLLFIGWILFIGQNHLSISLGAFLSPESQVFPVYFPKIRSKRS